MTAGEIVQNIRMGYLFDIDRRVRRALDFNRITDQLRATFADNGHFLPNDSLVCTIRKGRHWEIRSETTYAIRGIGKRLTVCKPIEAMTRKQLADRIGIRRETITSIENGQLALSLNVAEDIVGNIWMTDEQSEGLIMASCRQALDGINATAERARRKLVRKYIRYPKCIVCIGEEERNARRSNYGV